MVSRSKGELVKIAFSTARRGCVAVQPPCIRVVYWAALSTVVHGAEAALCHRIDLPRSQALQPHRLFVVYWAALPVVVHNAEAALRHRVALRRSEAVQPPCLRVVYWAAVFTVVHLSLVPL